MYTPNCPASPNDASNYLKKLSEANRKNLSAKKGGYAEGVIVAIHGLREYLDHPYRRLLDILREMPTIVAKSGLSVNELPDFTTAYARKQNLKMPVWRMLLQLSAELFDAGEV